MKAMNMFTKVKPKGETKSVDKKALAAGKKAYKAVEAKSLKAIKKK